MNNIFTSERLIKKSNNILIVFLALLCCGFFFILFNPLRFLLVSIVEKILSRSLNFEHWNFKITNIAITGFISVFLYLCWLLLQKTKYSYLVKNKYFLLILIILLSSLPLFFPGIHLGHDTHFHLMRIAGIAEELKNGNFPARLQSIWLDGYGYPVSIYYGDIFLYIPALFHLSGISLTGSYKIYLLLINIITAITANYCFNKIFENIKVSLLITLIYMTAPYRFVDVFVRSAVGEYSAFIFFPLVALAFYELYSKPSDAVEVLRPALLLAVGMSGLIFTHILSTELVVIILFIIFLVLFKKSFSKKVILSISSAVVFTLLLSATFIIPFLDYFINVPVNINQLAPLKIQSGGVYLIQLFMFFQNPTGLNSPILKERMLFSPGLPLLFGLFFSIFYIIRKQKDKTLIFFVSFSLLTIVLSLNLFPYDILSETIIGRIATQIQFPWRWLGIEVILGSLLIGRLLLLVKKDTEAFEENKRNLISLQTIHLAVFLVFLQFFTYSIQFAFEYSEYNIENVEGLSTRKISGAEYLRKNVDVEKFTHSVDSKNVEISSLTRKGNSFDFYVKANTEGYVELPVINYKGYKAKTENGKYLNIVDGNNNVVRIIIPENFNGKIKCKFEEPLLWKISEIISLLSVIGIIILLCKKKE